MSWRDYWQRKPGPILTPGRLTHFGVGALATLLCRILWGDAGLAVGFLAVGGAGWAWERATKYLAPIGGWPHPFGDPRDLAAFILGWLIVAVPSPALGATVTDEASSTWISSAGGGSVNHSDSGAIFLAQSAIAGGDGLLRFDLAIPAGATITDASITVKVLTVTGTPGDFDAHTIKRDYVNTEATWNEWATGSSWTTAGAKDCTLDRDCVALASAIGPGVAGDTLTIVSGAAAVTWVEAELVPDGVAALILVLAAENSGVLKLEGAGTGPYHPLLSVTYTEAATATPDRRRRRRADQ